MRRFAGCLVLALVACQGSDAPPLSVTAVIGPAGGTVVGPSGAEVTIPPGALEKETMIGIAESSDGAPPMLAGVTPFGPMFAFTPHGTKFAVPVVITVPFDPAKVPSGTTLVLYKTNAAQTGWAAVDGATASGGSMTGQVTSFSFVFYGPLPPPPLEKGAPRQAWLVNDMRRNGAAVDPSHDKGNQKGLLLEKPYDFGPASALDPGVPLPVLLPREFRATGRIFSSPGGGSYSVSGEAPISRTPEDVAGNLLQLHLTQSYRKHDPNATLRLHITQGRIEAYDDASATPAPCNLPASDPNVSLCDGQMDATVILDVSAYNARKPHLFVGSATLDLHGWRRHWEHAVGTVLRQGSEVPEVPLWSAEDADFDADVEGQDGRGARFVLRAPVTVPIDISSIRDEEEFTLEVYAITTVFNGRPVGTDGASYLGAFLRDPTQIGGDAQIITEGLEPTDLPEPPPEDPSLPAECRARPPAGQLQFVSPHYSVLEGAGASGVNLLVMRTGGSAGEVSATVTTTDGTATAPGDYLGVHTTVTFADGDIAPRFVHVPLVYSTDAEPDKTFTVELSAPTGCARLGLTQSVVTILDDTRPVPAPTPFTIGGVVTGLEGTGLALRTNLFDQLQPAGNGRFAFVIHVADGTAYTVSVVTQPTNPLQFCTVTNGSGTVAGADVTNIAVDCATTPPDGKLDGSFGGGQGKIVDPLAGAQAIALQPDGKILALGHLTLSRYNADGSVDAAFGTGGRVAIVANGGGTDAMLGLALQPDGKIVVAGHTAFLTASNNDNMVILRYHADGSPDTDFGTAGKVVIDFDGMLDQASEVLVQPDGKIVAAGYAILGTFNHFDSDFALFRMLPDGRTDPAFGTGGKATLNVAGRSDIGTAAALAPDGKIVVVGRVFSDGTDQDNFGVARFLTDGTPDLGFGTEGTVRIDFSTGGVVPPSFTGGLSDEPADVAVQPDGRIVIVGRTEIDTHFHFALARLRSDGGLDPDFGTGGLTSSLPATVGDEARAIAFQPDGRIVVAGIATFGGPTDFAIARYTDKGTLDPSWGDGGLLTIDFLGDSDTANDVLVQPDGKIVIGGSARLAGAALARVLP